MHKIQLVDFLRSPPQKRYFLRPLKIIDCQALLFPIFSTTAEQAGLVQQSNKIVVRYAHIIYPYSLGL